MLIYFTRSALCSLALCWSARWRRVWAGRLASHSDANGRAEELRWCYSIIPLNIPPGWSFHIFFLLNKSALGCMLTGGERATLLTLILLQFLFNESKRVRWRLKPAEKKRMNKRWRQEGGKKKKNRTKKKEKKTLNVPKVCIKKTWKMLLFTGRKGLVCSWRLWSEWHRRSREEERERKRCWLTALINKSRGGLCTSSLGLWRTSRNNRETPENNTWLFTQINYSPSACIRAGSCRIV